MIVYSQRVRCSLLCLHLRLVVFVVDESAQIHLLSVIIGKLLCAIRAWWGFASAADRQSLQALLQSGIRSGLCSPEAPTLTELVESMDDTFPTHHAQPI